MKRLLAIGAASAIVIVSTQGFAQTNAAPNPPGGMNCPMSDMPTVKKDMSSMMSDLDEMMKETNDPAMKARMSKLHDKMSAMMDMMQKMGGGMMDGGMMKGGMMKGGMMGGGAMQRAPGAGGTNAPTTPSTEEHQSHHPGQ